MAKKVHEKKKVTSNCFDIDLKIQIVKGEVEIKQFGTYKQLAAIVNSGRIATHLTGTENASFASGIIKGYLLRAIEKKR